MLLRASALTAALLVSGCRGDNPSLPITSINVVDGPAGTASPGRLASGDDSGDWVRAAKDYSSSRFTSLTEINAANASQLGVRLEPGTRG
jgi:hypothetical protein